MSADIKVVLISADIYVIKCGKKFGFSTRTIFLLLLNVSKLKNPKSYVNCRPNVCVSTVPKKTGNLLFV